MAIQQKGSQFEREICVKMSEWVTGGQKQDVFWRNSMSGGRATVFKKKGSLFRQSGDICAIAPEGHALTDTYYFELKHYKNLDFAPFLVKGKGVLTEFWRRTIVEANTYRLIPILIVKQNRMPILWISQIGQTPLHWTRNSRSWRLEVVHRKCMIYRFQDIMASDYVVTPRAKNTRIRL